MYSTRRGFVFKTGDYYFTNNEGYSKNIRSAKVYDENPIWDELLGNEHIVEVLITVKEIR